MVELVERLRRFGPDRLSDALPPFHWPAATAGQAQREWPALIAWVETLRERYEAFGPKVLPKCWFRHPSYVGAMQALRDHERVAYSASAPGTAGVDWHRALRDIETIVMRWSEGPVTCNTDHDEHIAATSSDDWNEFVTRDVERRAQRERDRVGDEDYGDDEVQMLMDAGVLGTGELRGDR
jgi:hypothetical protein